MLHRSKTCLAPDDPNHARLHFHGHLDASCALHTKPALLVVSTFLRLSRTQLGLGSRPLLHTSSPPFPPSALRSFLRTLAPSPYHNIPHQPTNSCAIDQTRARCIPPVSCRRRRFDIELNINSTIFINAWSRTNTHPEKRGPFRRIPVRARVALFRQGDLSLQKLVLLLQGYRRSTTSSLSVL